MDYYRKAIMEICDRYKCGGRAVGTDNGAPACYYHESRESYLMRKLAECTQADRRKAIQHALDHLRADR